MNRSERVSGTYRRPDRELTQNKNGRSNGSPGVGNRVGSATGVLTMTDIQERRTEPTRSFLYGVLSGSSVTTRPVVTTTTVVVVGRIATLRSVVSRGAECRGIPPRSPGVLTEHAGRTISAVAATVDGIGTRIVGSAPTEARIGLRRAGSGESESQRGDGDSRQGSELAM